jgi:hypothetical protein
MEVMKIIQLQRNLFKSKMKLVIFWKNHWVCFANNVRTESGFVWFCASYRGSDVALNQALLLLHGVIVEVPVQSHVASLKFHCFSIPPLL